MSDPVELAELRKQLTDRRASLPRTARDSYHELDDLKQQDRDSEYEENAQTELADCTLTHLLEEQRRELESIDAAVNRIDQGSYGQCVDCDCEIPLLRLKALPFARRFEEDTR